MLNGLAAPAGEGTVIEVHLDIMEASHAFLCRLNELGFEDDPFLEFHPAEYIFHYTGRTRSPQKNIAARLPAIRALAEQIIGEARDADVKLYVEIELVRSKHNFISTSFEGDCSGLDNFLFEAQQNFGNVQADIHLEFCAGTVPPDIRNLLETCCFYWVKTPETKNFPSEEIATLQTSTFHAAQMIYESLIYNPIPASTGIHLEQKLAMIPSHPALPMPQMISVKEITEKVHCAL